MSVARGERKHLVLLGAGHAQIEVLRRFGLRPVEAARIAIVTRAAHTPYSGMLPGVIAGQYQASDANFDIAALARFAGAELICDEVVGLDVTGRLVKTRSGTLIPYDLLSIDIGSQPNTTGTPGAAGRAIPVKPIDSLLGRFEAIDRDRLSNKETRVVLVGGGAAGVELMLAIDARLRRTPAATATDPRKCSLYLLTAEESILSGFPMAFREALVRELTRRGIVIRTDASVARVEDGVLHLADGETCAFDHLLWATQAAPAPWLRDSGLSLSQDGFLRVDRTLRAIGQNAIFAAGDIISFDDFALPKSGVYAVRAGPVLADNLRATLSGDSLQPFRPQGAVLTLLSTSDGRAVGTRNGLTVSGTWVWRWKRFIDRRFVARYRNLRR